MKLLLIQIVLLIIYGSTAYAQDTVSNSNSEKAVYAIFEPSPLTSIDLTIDLRGYECTDSIYTIPFDHKINGIFNCQGYSTPTWKWQYTVSDKPKWLMDTTELIFDAIPNGMFWYGIRFFRKQSDIKNLATFATKAWAFRIEPLQITFKPAKGKYRKPVLNTLTEYFIVLGVTTPLDTGQVLFNQPTGRTLPGFVDRIVPGYYCDLKISDSVGAGTNQPWSYRKPLLTVPETFASLIATGHITLDNEADVKLKDYKIFYSIHGNEDIDFSPVPLINFQEFKYHFEGERQPRASELLWWGDLDRDGLADLVLRHQNIDLVRDGKDKKQYYSYQLILSSEIKKYTCTESFIKSVNPAYQEK